MPKKITTPPVTPDTAKAISEYFDAAGPSSWAKEIIAEVEKAWALREKRLRVELRSNWAEQARKVGKTPPMTDAERFDSA